MTKKRDNTRVPVADEASHGLDYSTTYNKAYPTLAWLALTNECNLRCNHCSIRFVENRKINKVELTPTVFNRFKKDVLPNLKLLKFGGNNLGEQLMASNWDQFVEEIIDFDTKLALQTNGLLLQDDHINKLVDAGVEFNLSLEGADEASFKHIRGEGYDVLIENIKKIVTRRDETGSKSRIVFSYVMFYDNAPQLEKVIELASTLNVDEVAAMHLIPIREDQRYQSMSYHRAYSNEIIANAKAKASELGVRLHVPEPYYLGSMTSFINGDEIEKAALKPCYHPWTSVSINEKGEVLPCCGSYMVMGDLSKDDFSTIWNNRKYRKLRQKVNSSDPHKSCKNCILRDISKTEEWLQLSILGPNAGFDLQTVLARQFQKSLRRSSLGKKYLPKMKQIYKSRL